MFRSTAIALVALAAFDHIFLGGTYIHSVQLMASSILHFLAG